MPTGLIHQLWKNRKLLLTCFFILIPDWILDNSRQFSTTFIKLTQLLTFNLAVKMGHNSDFAYIFIILKIMKFPLGFAESVKYNFSIFKVNCIYLFI